MKTFDIFFGSSMVAITTFVYTNSLLLFLLCLFLIVSYLQFKFSFLSKYSGMLIPAITFVLSIVFSYIFKKNSLELLLLLNIPTSVYILEFMYLRFITKKHIA